MEINKICVMLIVLFLFVEVGFSQKNDKDFIKVQRADWEFVQNTYKETDSALVECNILNELYEQRMSEFQAETFDLRQANSLCDSIVVNKDKQLELRQAQVRIINAELKKMKFEVWVWRGVGILALIAGVAIAL